MRRVALGGMLALSVAASVTHGVVVVAGESMSPALEWGDVCVYRRHVDPKVGDIVVFRREDGARVVHRVIGVSNRGELRTKGDACEAADREPVTRMGLDGAVVMRVPAPWTLLN